MHLELLSAKYEPFCSSLNELISPSQVEDIQGLLQ